jgi:hypothetical protein
VASCFSVDGKLQVVNKKVQLQKAMFPKKRQKRDGRLVPDLCVVLFSTGL